MRHLDFVDYCPYPIVGGDDWEGAIILPEIACGSSCGGGFVVVVVVDVIPLYSRRPVVVIVIIPPLSIWLTSSTA